MTVRLYHVPEDAIDDLRAAYNDDQFMYCIQKWNDYEVSPEPLCYCLSGISAIKSHLPKLWINKPVSRSIKLPEEDTPPEG